MTNIPCVIESDNRRRIVPSIEELATFSDAQLAETDIAIMDFACAQGTPHSGYISISHYTTILDEWACLVKQCTERLLSRSHVDRQLVDDESQYRVLILTTVLQRNIGISYQRHFGLGMWDARDSNNMFVPGVVRTGLGTCGTLPVLFAAVGRRLDYPIEIVPTREHCFCRWRYADGTYFNFEAAGHGFSARDDNYYRKWPFVINSDVERKYRYLKSFTAREQFADALTRRAQCFLDNMYFKEAERCYELAYSNANARRGILNELLVARIINRAVRKQGHASNPVFTRDIARASPSYTLEAHNLQELDYLNAAQIELNRILQLS